MKWLWTRHRKADDEAAQQARVEAELALIVEQGRLVEANELANGLAGERLRNDFAERMWLAFGGHE